MISLNNPQKAFKKEEEMIIKILQVCCLNMMRYPFIEMQSEFMNLLIKIGCHTPINSHKGMKKKETQQGRHADNTTMDLDVTFNG